MKVACLLVPLIAAADLTDPLLPLWVMELLAASFFFVWLFCLGATVGSFLNVVVYRLPRGLNLAYPGSACPRCGHSIRLQDNIPILSWLVLRGRCRDCGGAIAPRYLLVELLTAIIFLLVLLAEYYLPAAELGWPCRVPLTRYDLIPFWARYGLHVCLAATLLAAALIRSDGVRVPPRLFLPIIVAGLCLPLVWPEIRSLPATSEFPFGGWRAGLADGLAGLAVGGLVGLIVALLTLYWQGRWPETAPVTMSAAVGIVLGWQHGLLGSFAIWLASGLVIRCLQTLSGPPDEPTPPPLPPASSEPEHAPSDPSEAP